MTQFEERRMRLAEAMEAGGDWPDRSPWIRDAVAALPRHLFAPDRLWCWDGFHYQPVDRAEDPELWAAEVYAGPSDPAVTQVMGGRASSSISCQAVVVDMLDALMLQEGHRVLELGTGAGWNASLLGWRAGPGRVVSVEVDAGLAAEARRCLAVAGADVDVQVGDGSLGWPVGAPYDRVISTYAVDRVPWEWVAQTRGGGRIVTPWGRLGHVALTVAEGGGSATGWVQGLAMFMPSRGSEAGLGWSEVRGDGPPQDERLVARELLSLRDDAHLLFAVRVVLPDVVVIMNACDGTAVWAHDGVSSWAMLSASDDEGAAIAHQGGPRRLVEELERARGWWVSEGRPELYDFGMTVEPDQQYVWCRDPVAGSRWPV
ncbi:protein-L-isoaspartate O-methyltransferase [Streptomyces sp. NPDC005970]|uniref:protein-L-isoaspartate O-methyltransferase n=1 Tax=Streptomyces sp. NPDC005970 TaxID=3156723 RepID=UPI00340D8DDC